MDKNSRNVIKHPLYESVYAMPIITIFLLEHDDNEIKIVKIEFYDINNYITASRNE